MQVFQLHDRAILGVRCSPPTEGWLVTCVWHGGAFDAAHLTVAVPPVVHLTPILNRSRLPPPLSCASEQEHVAVRGDGGRGVGSPDRKGSDTLPLLPRGHSQRRLEDADEHGDEAAV